MEGGSLGFSGAGDSPISNASGNQRDKITMALFLFLDWHALKNMCYIQ